MVNTPDQISFTPDGQQLVITTKLDGSLIDVFTMGPSGQPSDTFTANPAGHGRFTIVLMGRESDACHATCQCHCR